MARETLRAVICWTVLALPAAASAGDMYYYLRLSDLQMESALPVMPTKTPHEHGASWTWSRSLQRFAYPYAVADGAEVYVIAEGLRPASLGSSNVQQRFAAARLALRSAEGRTPRGRLYLPKPDWSGMVAADFALDEANADQAEARRQFYRAKEWHYQRLLGLQTPGAAWFRHQRSQARLEIGRGDQRGPAPTPAMSQSELQRTYALFTGGRAISENLQLNRELRVLSPSRQTEPIESISGITVAAYDWTKLVQGADVKLDALAACVPEDQHAVFFPTFQAMVALMDEAARNGAPILRLLESRGEDARTRERYERQLCLQTDALSRALGPHLVSAVAFTGSDPYLRTGSDVAVLLRSDNAVALRTAIAGRQAMAASTVLGCRPLSGSVRGVPYAGMCSPRRRVCSYAATLGSTVVVANSLTQLDRLVQVHQGGRAALASLDEYRFFRGRYPLGHGDETALLVVTDATIRRWCGPRWRIAASRRTRVAAAMAELQAQHLPDLAAGSVGPEGRALGSQIPGAGELHLTPTGVASSVYGTLEFLTPIAELAVDRVSPEEKRAYEWFRDGYQRRWRQFFDPIAARFTVDGARLATDVTVRPLIAASRYRRLAAVTGAAEIDPRAGDPHREALAHMVMALDMDSEPVRRSTSFAKTMVPGLGASPLAWVGGHVSLYADQDPLWTELEKVTRAQGERGAGRFMRDNLMRLPVALHVDVADPFKLAAFLVGVRAFIEQSSPGMTVWETRDHNGQPYVRIAPSERAKAAMRQDAWRDVCVCYAATPRALTITFSETLLRRALDRQAALERGEARPVAPDTWLGKSISANVQQPAFRFLEAMTGPRTADILRSRCWGNIVVLNEWRRRQGAEDPVGFHQRHWQTTLVCPGGGKYVWNEEFGSMESTVFGCPAQPKQPAQIASPLSLLASGRFGLTFEDDGLRAQVEVKRAGSARPVR